MLMSDNLTPEQIAVAILSSESFLWLMCGGGDWAESHLEALRPAWGAYIAAGGKTWGKPAKEKETDG